MKIKAYQIEENIKKDNFTGFLVYGQNKGLVREKIEQIKKIYSNYKKEIEIIRIDSEELKENPEKLYNEFNTFSLSGNKKILHILNTKDNVLEIISKSLIKNSNPTSLAIFESNELNPKSKLRKFFEKEKDLAILPCYFDMENDVRELIEKKFKEENISIERNLTMLLVKRLGSERSIIKNELEKIILFLKDKKKITEKDIINCISDNKNFNFDDLNYNLCDGNLVNLDNIINQLYLEGISPLSLLRSASKHFQKILFVNEKILSGLNIDDSIKLLKPPIFFLYKSQFKSQVQNWKNNLCYKALERIFDAESLCKLNSKLSKIICWRTLRNIGYIKYK